MEDIFIGAVALHEEPYKRVPIRAGQPIRGPVLRAPTLVFRLIGGTIRAGVVKVNAARVGGGTGARVGTGTGASVGGGTGGGVGDGGLGAIVICGKWGEICSS